MLWVIQKFHYYLIGAHFILVTDHKPLEWLESAKVSHAQSQHLEQWSLELMVYDFDVVHKSGAVSLQADALSRYPVILVAVHPSLN